MIISAINLDDSDNMRDLHQHDGVYGEYRNDFIKTAKALHHTALINLFRHIYKIIQDSLSIVMIRINLKNDSVI